MRERVCNNCGGKRYVVVGQNTVKCMFCGTIYVDEVASQEQEVLIVNAYQKLRAFKFTDALKDFEKIIAQFPLSHEAYYGALQAKHRIVYYSSKEGLKKYPLFFGKEIPSVLEDQYYKKAIELAPKAVAENYTENVEKIEKLHEDYLEVLKEDQKFDVIVNSLNSEDVKEIYDRLTEEKLSVFLRQDAKKYKQQVEAWLFYVLQNAKVQVLYVDNVDTLDYAKVLNLADRFWYRINHKERFPSSFIIAYDDAKVDKEQIKKVFPNAQVFLEANDKASLDKLVKKVKEAVERSYNEPVTLEKKNVEKVTPKKKESVEIHTIAPSDLGHYTVENVPLSNKNKLKWVYFSIKNGDYATAEEVLNTPEYIESKDGEVEFARILCEKKINSVEAFFSNTKNITDIDKLERVIKNAPAEFADSLINNWEDLVIKTNTVDEYKKNILFLAQYQNSGRDKFLSSAENVALETLDDELIQKILQCFSANDIEKYINFYFQLAQKTGDDSYYEMILDLDEGHMPSHFALFAKNFDETEERLSFRDKKVLENVLQYCDETQSANFLTSLCDMITGVAFYNINKAEEQLDFYLSYITKSDALKNALVKTASALQSMRFFSLAEKYIVLAIKEDPKNAELYWQLIQIKTHCKNESELVTTSVKISDMDDWATVLNYATEKQAEKYSQIISSSNLSVTEKRFREEIYDKDNLKKRLSEFLVRNNSILKEYEDQGLANYYRLQLTAFDQYFTIIEDADNFEDYIKIYDRVFERLELMGLTLDSSINVVDFIKKKDNYKVVKSQAKKRDRKYLSEDEVKEQVARWKKILFFALEVVPMAIITLFHVLVMFYPEDMYLTFTQNAVFIGAGIAMFIGLCNIIYSAIKKRKSNIKWKLLRASMFLLALVNVALMSVIMFISPAKIDVSTAEQFSSILHHARYLDINLKADIDLKDIEWVTTNLNGNIEGNEHTIHNVKFKNGQNGLFKNFNGDIYDLTIEISEFNLLKVESYGAISGSASGKFENVNVVYSGNSAIESHKSRATIGGLIGELKGGTLKNCSVKLADNTADSLNIIADSAYIGGLVGLVEDTAVEIGLCRSDILGNFTLTNCTFGGLVGEVDTRDSIIEQSFANVDLKINIDSNMDNIGTVGGLIGILKSGIKNCYVTGDIRIGKNTTKLVVGGLTGVFNPPKGNFLEVILNVKDMEDTYANIKLLRVEEIVDGEITDEQELSGINSGDFVYGLLVAKYINGNIKTSFAIGNSADGKVYAEKDGGFLGTGTCHVYQSVDKFKSSEMDFDIAIWNIEEDSLPTLKYNNFN